ncbi:MAG: DNA polymerase III subunit delta' [Candidatus Omnitrophica bacterium]|nr:DNA polymerase III subunit delta' [Candidatus Omnitrophota bacterium]
MAWSAILGQPFAIRLLRAHVQRKRLASAYLLIGPEGIGKRALALELAKTLNCERASDDACDQCGPCRRIAKGSHPDVHMVSPQGNAQTIRIDDVRAVLHRVALRPFQARHSVAVLDGVERLTEEAANSLLKALEEPPAHATWVLLTPQPANVLPTILSRCQAVRCRRLPASLIESWLASEQGCPAEMAAAAGRLAQGSLASAKSFADRWQAYSEMTAQFHATAPLQWLQWETPADRKALEPWMSGTIHWMRDLMVASHGAEALIQHAHAADAVRGQAARVDPERCVTALLRCVDLWESSQRMVSPRAIGTLLREEWLQLLGQGAGDEGQGNPRPMPHAPCPS